MGVVETITHDRFPKQGNYLGKRVKVLFHYDTEHSFMGTIVRDDVEQPFETIIRLDVPRLDAGNNNGLFVLATECQYSIEK